VILVAIQKNCVPSQESVPVMKAFVI